MKRLFALILVATCLVPAVAAAAPPVKCAGLAATITGTDGDDLIYGTVGNDVISAGAGDDIIKGRGGMDTICGNTGDDIIYDGPEKGAISHPVTMYGGIGNDTFYLDAYGTAYGQDGNDTFFITRGDHNLLGGPGRDTIDARRSIVGVNVDLRLDLIEGAGSFGSGMGSALLFDFENAVGSAYSDDFQGDRRANRFRGLSGHDTLYGRGGNDRLIGNSGNDMLMGGPGNDFLWGGPGICDGLDGGSGTDTCTDAVFLWLDNCES